MKRFILLISILTLTFSNIQAQGVCGTAHPTHAEYDFTKNVVSNIMLTANAGLTCVPIRPHIVRMSNGSGGISLADINSGISHLNEYYYDMGVEFYLCGTTPDYIDEDTLYDFQTSEEVALATAGNEVTNAINMYFVDGINFNPSAGSFIAGYAYLPANSLQSIRIVMRNLSTPNGGTLVHELGHHYNLLHTFQNTVNGNADPDAENVPRPPSAQANCTTDGDLLCDTEADPGYSGATFNTGTCTYTGGGLDINGIAYTPPITNVMSYFPGSCQNPAVLSPGQYVRMQQGKVVRDGHSAYTMDCPPSVVSDPSGLTASFNGLVVDLSWTDNANNEMGYFIERSTTSAVAGFRAFGGFGTDVDATSFSDNSISASTTYYYRVKAVNDGCDDYSNVAMVTTGASVICLSSGNNGSDEYISNVTLGTINNSTGSDNYTYYSALSTDLTVGSVNPYSISNPGNAAGGGNGYFNDTCAIWIDWNQDGDFDEANELVVHTGGTGPYTGNITPPATAVIGTTIMRVRIHYIDEASSPCGNTVWGEVEDYEINVLPLGGTPTIVVNNTNLTGFTYQENSGPSMSQLDTVSASNLNGTVYATNVASYEFSYDGLVWFSDVDSIVPFAGTIPPSTIFVRLISGLAAGTYNDTMTLSSTGATPVVVNLSGTVTAAPVVNCSELFFSEYIEGSGNNKCIEIYNPTAGTVDLGAGNYQVKRYTNGSATSSSTLNLVGMIPSGGVYVVCNASSSATFQALSDTLHSVTGWNGDDAVELVANGSTIDVIGQIGFDPGSSWSGGSPTVSTANQTMVRKTAIEIGDDNGSNVFDPSIEWDGHAQNEASFLGSHVTACVAPVTFDWTGTTNSDWNTASNWSGNTVPTSTDSVTIPDVSLTTGNFPIISPSTVLGDITVDASATLTITTGIILNDIFVNNGSVILQNGAYLDDFTNLGSSFLGEITVETNATNGVSNDQRLISSPVNTPMFGEIADDLLGPWGTGAQGIDGVPITIANCALPTLTPTSNYGNMFEFDESLLTLGGCDLDGWVVRSAGTLANGTGYSAYLSSGSTFDFTGTPNSGNIMINVSNSGSMLDAEGWNLIGNPYPSSLSRDDVVNTGLSDIQYHVTTGIYQGSYSPYLPSSNIAIAQGFQAHTNTTSAITFNNSMRNTNPATWYSNDNWYKYKLEVSIFGNNFGDKTILYYNNDATESYEALWDVTKRESNSGQPTLSTVNGSKNLSLNGLSVENLGETIPLDLKVGTSGTFNFDFAGVETFPTNTTIYLKDNELNAIHNITDGNYGFTASVNDYANRFELIFIPEIQLSLTNEDCDGNKGLLNIADLDYTSGRIFELYSNNALINSDIVSNLDIELGQGIYTLKVKDAYNGVQIYDIEIESLEEIQANFDISKTEVEVGEIIYLENKTVNSNSNLWDFGNGNLLSNINNPTFAYLNEGTFELSYSVENEDCFDNKKVRIVVSAKTTSINNVDDSKIVIHPNPVKDILYIEYANKIHVELLNILGTKVLIGNSKKIDMTGLSSGIYFVNIYNDDMQMLKTSKIIKE